MTRYAGDVDVSAFMTGPDLGKLSQKSAVNDAKFNIAGIKSEANIGAAGLSEYGATIGNQAVMDAQSSLAAAQAQASTMSMIGNLAGAGIGAMKGMGGGGAAFGEVGTSGSDMADFGYTPAQDKAFHSGEGIDYGYL